MKVFHSTGPNNGNTPVATLSGNLPGSPPMRPFIGVQTKEAADKQHEVDYVFAYEGQ